MSTEDAGVQLFKDNEHLMKSETAQERDRISHEIMALRSWQDAVGKETIMVDRDEVLAVVNKGAVVVTEVGKPLETGVLVARDPEHCDHKHTRPVSVEDKRPFCVSCLTIVEPPRPDPNTDIVHQQHNANVAKEQP